MGQGHCWPLHSHLPNRILLVFPVAPISHYPTWPSPQTSPVHHYPSPPLVYICPAPFAEMEGSGASARTPAPSSSERAYKDALRALANSTTGLPNGETPSLSALSSSTSLYNVGSHHNSHPASYDASIARPTMTSMAHPATCPREGVPRTASAAVTEGSVGWAAAWAAA